MRPAYFYGSLIIAAIGPALGAGSLVLLAAPPPKFEAFQSEEGRFRIRMLPDPKVSSTKLGTPAGAIPLTTVRSDVNRGLSLGVTFADYPENFLDLDPKTILDGVRDGLKGSDGKVISDKDVKFGREGKQLSAREIVITSGRNTIRVRLILMTGRLYQIMVTGSDSRAMEQFGDEFLDSFELLK